MKNVCITDLTLTVIPFAQKKVALGFCMELFHMGVDYIEMTPSVFRRIKDDFPAEHVSLKIEHPDEYLYYSGQGIHAFSVAAADIEIMAKDTEGTRHVKEEDAFTVIYSSQDDTFTGTNNPVKLGAAKKIRLCGCDTVMQGDYVSSFSYLNEKFGDRMEFDPHDKCYMATAAAIEYLFHAGRNICTSFCGLYGHAATEQVMAALNLMADTKFDLTRLPKLRALFESFGNRTLPYHLPVAGQDIFAYESGIHADGIKKNPANYEPFDPKFVGAKRKLVIGKHSGKSAIRQKLLEFGYMPGEPILSTLNSEVRKLSEKNGRSLSDDEFLNLYIDLRDGIEGD